MPAGRPTTYTKDLQDIICERLAAGESMRSISRDENMPACSTMFKWLREHEEFSEQYAIAKEESADALVEDMLDIADNQVEQPLVIDGKPLLDDNGKPILIKDAVSVNHARLRVDTRKWAASKLKPKKYGDKIQTEHSGQVTHNMRDVTDMTDEELQAEIDRLSDE
jgi:transposase-like protein